MSRAAPPNLQGQALTDYQEMNGRDTVAEQVEAARADDVNRQHMREFRRELDRPRLKPSQITDALRAVLSLETRGVSVEFLSVSAHTKSVSIHVDAKAMAIVDRLMGHPQRLEFISKGVEFVAIEGNLDGVKVDVTGPSECLLSEAEIEKQESPS